MQYHNCKLEDIVVAQIALTLSVQMIKNDSIISVISVISVWHVGRGIVGKSREYNDTIS